MPFFLSHVGLGPSGPLHTSGFLMWNWFYAYGVLSTRPIKQYYGVDHNVSPRQDIGERCEQAVKDGRMKRQTLEKLKRNQAAHENAVEGYTLFIGSVLFGMITQLPNQTIDAACLSYTLARLVYGPAYIFIEQEKYAWIRSVAWWWGNLSCLTLLWKGGNALLLRT